MTGAGGADAGLERAVAAALGAGVDWVQLRERRLDAGPLLGRLEALRAAARGAGCWIVNRRLDVALAAGADGVHLGFDALGPGSVRELLALLTRLADAPDAPAPRLRIGVSCHHPDEVAAAAAAGADYAHLAPIFDPLSKPRERPALGLAALAEAARHGLPVLAQGGIEPANAGEVLEAGAAGVAVTGAVLGVSDPASAAGALRSALDGACR